MNDIETTLHDVLPQDVTVRSPDPSLAISPNLDALLEHDERTRQTSLDYPRSPYLFHSPVVGSFTAPFPVGLPPPPRGNRKGGSRPTTPKDADRAGSRSTRRSDASDSRPGSSGSQAVSTSNTNPFLNPPPRLSRRTDGSSRRDQSTTRSAPDPPNAATMPDSLRKALDRLVDSPISATEPDPARDSPSSLRSHTTSIKPGRDDTGSLGPSDHPYASPLLRSYPATMPRADKLIGKNKNMYSTSSSQPQNNPRTDRIIEGVETPSLGDGWDRSKLPDFSELPSLCAFHQ